MSVKKIINDPVYGFISVPSALILNIINHPYFQRLRRIKQLGLTDLVYPGAVHTRFHHALGAMHLMQVALNTLKNKGHKINKEEHEAALIAILLHDIGHGPFSHALEYGLLTNISHEKISVLLMKKLNREFGGKLDLAIKIYEGKYNRKFFHQLVSSQLDVDRMDYLSRDYYFTGVAEGKIAYDRIIKMLDIVNDEIVVEEKGIYSIENFLNARRLMYWQVYLHKTVISAEFMLLRAVQRAKELHLLGKDIYMSNLLKPFFQPNVSISDFENNELLVSSFTALDDADILSAVKEWQHSKDKPLSVLSKALINRELFKVELSGKDFSKNVVDKQKKKLKVAFSIGDDAIDYLLIKGVLSNNAYIPRDKKINILTKKGKVIDVSEAVDLPNIKAFSIPVHKFFMCWPRNI